MSVLAELQATMDEPGIKGQLATELHDITEQYNDGILTEAEYKDLVIQIKDTPVNDETTSRWVANIVQVILLAV